MSKNNPVENTGTAIEKEVVSKKITVPKFSIEQLGENCRQLFGVSSCTFAGATHGMTEKYTVEEMKAHIEKWRSKEVK